MMILRRIYLIGRFYVATPTIDTAHATNGP